MRADLGWLGGTIRAVLAHDLQDEGFHEIQLNGKQLVFLFMAATVVSVVIFLLGVFVGRGVRAERGTVADSTTASTAVAETSPTPQPAAAVPVPPPAGSDPTAAAPPKEAPEDLSYFKRLDKATSPAEKLRPAPKEDKVERPAPAPPPAAAAPPPAAPSAGEPTGQGYVVQIAALNVRSDAEAIAKRLSNKGYAAYVVAPPDGTPAVYRVRVGKFPTKREADSVAAKLQKEEQFKPWVTR
jgi:septal ring-binding cell division protein DamX